MLPLILQAAVTWRSNCIESRWYVILWWMMRTKVSSQIRNTPLWVWTNVSAAWAVTSWTCAHKVGAFYFTCVWKKGGWGRWCNTRSDKWRRVTSVARQLLVVPLPCSVYSAWCLIATRGPRQMMEESHLLYVHLQIWKTLLISLNLYYIVWIHH